MHQAIILAHPNPHSFCAGLSRACEAASVTAGHTVCLRDLYGIGFDPRLTLQELPDQPQYQPPAEILEERRLLETVDTFTFIYPLWFNAPPAILKGYVDRVFSMGFGYHPALGGAEPALTGRRFLSITTSGAPDDWLRATGALDALITLFDRHLCSVTGMTWVDHTHVGGLTAGLREDVLKAKLDRASQQFALALK